jgi:hypothetical protein
LYSSPGIIRIIKPRKIRWVRHAAYVGEKFMKCFGVKLERKNRYEDLSIDGFIILKWVLKITLGFVDWIRVVQDSDQWRDLINTITSLGAPCWGFLE